MSVLRMQLATLAVGLWPLVSWSFRWADHISSPCREFKLNATWSSPGVGRKLRAVRDGLICLSVVLSFFVWLCSILFSKKITIQAVLTREWRVLQKAARTLFALSLGGNDADKYGRCTYSSVDDVGSGKRAVWNHTASQMTYTSFKLNIQSLSRREKRELQTTNFHPSKSRNQTQSISGPRDGPDEQTNTRKTLKKTQAAHQGPTRPARVWL